MVRLIPGFIARRQAAARERQTAAGKARVAAYQAERYRIETQIESGAAREWTVTAPLRVNREDDEWGTLIELHTGTALRYEYIHRQGGQDGGGWSSASRRFLVVDGEHAGARVRHLEMSYRDDEGVWREPASPFPPAGLEPKAG